MLKRADSALTSPRGGSPSHHQVEEKKWAGKILHSFPQIALFQKVRQVAAMPCVENPLALAPGLHSWEQTFIKDCPTSPFGDVRPFDFSSRNSTAAAHFTLGLKALHNFFFDLCKYEFDQARLIEPTLFMAYWGRALCEAQLVWNGENVPASVEVIRAAQTNPEFPGSMSERELAYFQSVVTLNGGMEPPSTPDTVVATRPARIAA